MQFDHKNKKLSYNLAPNAFIVIDGQHRLYGSHQSEQVIVHYWIKFQNSKLNHGLKGIWFSGSHPKFEVNPIRFSESTP